MNKTIGHQVFSMDEVMQYFAKGFRIEGKDKISMINYYIDPAKGKVVIELLIEKEDDKKKDTA